MVLDPVDYSSYRKPNQKHLKLKANFYYSETGRGLKIQFLAFKTIELARAYIRDKYLQPHEYREMAEAAGYFQPVYCKSDKNLIGVIVVGGMWIKDFIVVHECCHAVFHWFTRSGKKIDEEDFCVKLGRLSGGTLRFCLESLTADELLPP